MILLSGAPVDERGWEQLVRVLMRARLKLAGMSYAGLNTSIAAIGVEETEIALRSKINRGRFTASFLLQCLNAMEVDEAPLPARRTARA